MTDFKYHVTSGKNLWTSQNWIKAYGWSIKQFGESNFDFDVRASEWRFLNEEDAVWFALRWA